MVIIFTYKNILDKAGVFLNLNTQEGNPEDTNNDNILTEPETFGDDADDPQGTYSKYSLEELHNLLDEAIQNEDYEKAAIIKEEIDKKES